jgi:hypothetical protein
MRMLVQKIMPCRGGLVNVGTMSHAGACCSQKMQVPRSIGNAFMQVHTVMMATSILEMSTTCLWTPR